MPSAVSSFWLRAPRLVDLIAEFDRLVMNWCRLSETETFCMRTEDTRRSAFVFYCVTGAVGYEGGGGLLNFSPCLGGSCRS